MMRHRATLAVVSFFLASYGGHARRTDFSSVAAVMSTEYETEIAKGAKIQLRVGIATGPTANKSHQDEKYKYDNQLLYAKILASDKAHMTIGRVVLGGEITKAASTMEQVEDLGLSSSDSICAACIECVSSGGKFVEFAYTDNKAKKSKWCTNRGSDDCSGRCAAHTVRVREVSYDFASTGSGLTLSHEDDLAQNAEFTMTVDSNSDMATLLEQFKLGTRFYLPINVEGHHRDNGRGDPIDASSNTPYCIDASTNAPTECYWLFFSVLEASAL